MPVLQSAVLEGADTSDDDDRGSSDGEGPSNDAEEEAGDDAGANDVVRPYEVRLAHQYMAVSSMYVCVCISRLVLVCRAGRGRLQQVCA